MKRVQYIGTNMDGMWLPGDVAFAPRMGAAVEVEDELARDLLSREYEGKPEWRLETKTRSSSSSSKPRSSRSSSSRTTTTPTPATPAEPTPAPADTEES